MIAPKAAAHAALSVALLVCGDASALLIDKLDQPGYSYFYPYPTAFTAADRGYAFDDDPLAALPIEPYAMAIVERPPESQPLIEPRMSFVPEMVDSGEDL